MFVEMHYAKSGKAFKCSVIRNYKKIRKIRKLIWLLVLEDVMQCRRMLYKGASVLTISMGPEYPGLDDSVLLEGNGVPLED
jgi:hypothetical protein